MGKRKSSYRRSAKKAAPHYRRGGHMSTASLRKQVWITSPYRASFDRLTPNKLRNMGEGPVPTSGAWRVSGSWW